MSNDFQIKGIQSQTGVKYVRISMPLGGVSALVPLVLFSGSGRPGLEALNARGMPIIGTKNCTMLINQVAEISQFDVQRVVEKVGWNGPDLFAFPSGDALHTNTQKSAECAIVSIPQKCSSSGSLEGWLTEVAEPMAGQSVLEFSVMFTFAAPILALSDRLGNFGFELVAAKGTGKTTAQRLMSSVIGGAGHARNGRYFEPFDTTLNALEDLMAVHSDLPLILEEANLFAADLTARSVATRFKALAFKLSSGTVKSRFGALGTGETQLLYFVSANEPLSSLIGENTEGAKAAADRLITIPISSDREHGVLDFVPSQYASAGAFLDSVVEAAERHCGHSMRCFIQQLVHERTADEAALRTEISDGLAEFRAHAGVSDSNGSERRVADAFGLVFVAATLAKRYGAIPSSFKCGRSVLACYNLHRLRKPVGISFAQQIEALAASAEAVQLGRGKLSKLTDAQWRSGIFVRSRPHGAELLIAPDKIDKLLPNWSAIRQSPEVRKIMNTEVGRIRVKRKLCANRTKVRFYAFKLLRYAIKLPPALEPRHKG